MKKTNGFRIVLFAFATMLFFTQCAKEQSAQQGSNDATNTTTTAAEKSIKIAFVDIDSLLAKYEFSIIVNKEMLRKEEDMRMKLAEKAKLQRGKHYEPDAVAQPFKKEVFSS